MRVRRLRRILAVAAVIVAALAIGGTIAISQIDPSDYRDTLTARVEAATGRAFAIGGDMTMTFGLTPQVTLNDVRFADAAWAGDSPMVTADTVKVRMALLPLAWGNLRLRRVEVTAPTIHLTSRPDGPPNWDLPGLDDARDDHGRRNLLSGFQRLIVRDAAVTYAASPDAARYRGAVPRLDGTPGSDGGLDLRGTARVRDTELTLRGTVGPPDLALVPGHHYPIALRLSGFGGTAAVKGTVIDPVDARRLDVDVKVTSDSPGVLARRLGLPRVRGDRLSLDAGVTGTNGRFAVRGLDARLGATEVTGRAVLDTKTRPNRLTANVSAPTLDLRGLWRPAGDAESAGRRIFPGSPLPWRVLALGHADVKLRAGAVKLARNLTATDLETHATLANGTLRVHTLDAALAGGNLRATLEARSRATPPRVSARLHGDSIAYGRILADAGITDAVTGTARVDADLTARGRSPRALAQTLAGTAAVIADRGRIDHALVAAASAGLGDLLAPWRDRGKDVRLTCAVAKLAAADGTLDSRVLLADTPTATLGGEGAVDLGAERYDLRLVPKAKQPSLASLAVPVRVTGPLRAPEIGPDPLGAAKAGAIAIGSLVNPLVTLGALVVESQTNAGNPCVAAIEKARAKAESNGDNESDGDVDGGFFDDLSRSIDDALGVEDSDDTNDEPVLPDEQRPSGR